MIESTGWSLSDRVGRDHIAQFYDDDAFLCRMAADFLATGLEQGQAAIAFASAEHCSMLQRDVEARTKRPLVCFDRDEFLERFIVSDMPDRDAVMSYIDDVTRQFVTGGVSSLRIYGEMAGELLRRRNSEAALALENVWVEKVNTRPILLLCAYDLEHFQGEEGSNVLHEVCRRHMRAHPAA